MHRLLFLGWFLFLLTTAVAQEKVTDFENFATQSPNNFKYIGKLQDKIIFIAFTPETGIELWISGGRPENTKMLKDINVGEISTYMHNFTFHGDWLYFTIDNKIWKTDGTEENTIKIFESDKGGSLLELSTIEDKILVIMSTYLLDKNTEFFWLKKDKLEKWEENIVTYNVIPNSLVFTKQTTSSQTFTYYHFRIRKQEIYISKNLDWQTITQFSHGNENYVSLYNSWESNAKRILIHIKAEGEFKVLDWGKHEAQIPLYFTDEDSNLYLMKLNTYETDKDSLFIYKSINGDLRLEKHFSPKTLNPRRSFSGTNDFYSNVIFKYNKVIFINGSMSYGIRIFYFNAYDLLNDTYTQKFFPVSPIDNYGNIFLAELNDSTYKVTATDFSLIYHPISNTISKRINREDDTVLINDTGHVFEFSDNLYLLKDSLKSALIKSRKIFKNNWLEISRHTYKDKQYLLLNGGSWVNKHHEMWVLDSTSQKKILSGKDYVYTFVQPNGIPDKIYYAVSDTTKLHLYEMDMPTNKYKLLKSFPLQTNISYNDHTIIGSDTSHYTLILKDKLVEIPKEKEEHLFSVLPDIMYVAKNCENEKCFYLLTEREKKLIYKADIYNVDTWNYQNILYLKDRRRIISINEKQNVRVLVDSVDSIQYFKNYLVTISQKAGLYTYSTIDLKLNKVVSVFNDKAEESYNIQLYKNWLFYSKRTTDEVLYYNEKEYIKIPLPVMGNYSTPTFYKDGFFISSSTQTSPIVYTILYYNINTKVWTTVMKDPKEGYPFFNVYDVSDFVIISQRTNKEGTKYSLWNYATNQLQSIPLRDFGEIKGNYITNYENGTTQIYYLPDFLPAYKILPAKETDAVDVTDIVNVTSSFTNETGAELMVLGPNYFVNMPEIVKGKEGMILKDYFYINNTLYIYAFTYTHGWQVWKMGEFNPGRILATENSSEVGLVVYPNPVQDFLHINTEKPLNYKLVNIIGQEVKRGKVSARELIDVKNIPTGIYIIQLFDGTANFARKIIKH